MFSLLKAATEKAASLSSSSPNMGRVRPPPTPGQPDPDPNATAIPAIPSSETSITSTASAITSLLAKPRPSASITSSPASFCPHCKTNFHDMAIREFQDHVASCTRPSTAEDDGNNSDTSELTDLDESSFVSPARGNLPISTKDKDDIPLRKEDEVAFIPDPFDFGVKEPEPSPAAIKSNGASRKNVLSKFQYGIQVQGPRPYTNPDTKFDFYNEVDGHQQVEDDPEDPENAMKFRFPQLHDAEEFAKYLEDPDEMQEAELYDRTSKVSDILKAYQDEYDAIEKEVNAHEAWNKADQEQAVIRAKEQEAEQKAFAKEQERQKSENRRRELNVYFKTGSRSYDNALKQEDPLALELQSLMTSMEYEGESPKDKKVVKQTYAYAPLPEAKLTKDEIDAEKRKLGRLMTTVKFNDMKTADAYGFEYNPHVKYVGAQPLASAHTKRRGERSGPDNSDGGRLRTSRQPNRKFYEENSGGSDSEGLPAKRVRKIRNFDDAGENAARSRPTSHSRGGTPAPRVFPSGKKVGRPSKADVLARSKLSNSMIAPSSATPEGSQGTGTADESRGAQKLAEDVQEDLQTAAAGVINKAAPENGIIAVEKPRNKGGRPRKNKAVDTSTNVVAPPAKKNKGGRPRKHPLPVNNIDSGEEVETPAKRRRFKKEQGHDNIMSFGTENGVLESTEEYDGRRGETAESSESRPTSSSSNATTSSFGSRRSTRPQTQAKTEAREQRIAAKAAKERARAESSKRKRDDEEPSEIFDSTSGRGKRNKIAHHPYDPSSSVDIETPASKAARLKKRTQGLGEIQFDNTADDLASSSAKKRRGRHSADGTNSIPVVGYGDDDAMYSSSINKRRRSYVNGSNGIFDNDDDVDDDPSHSAGRKRIRGDSTSIAVAGPSTEAFGGSLTPSTDPAPSAAKKSRTKYAKAKPVEVSIEDWEPDKRSDDGRHLSLIEDPVEREEVRKRRVKRGKSDKLSASMHARWNDGRMIEAMETRKANAEKKKTMGATSSGPKNMPSSRQASSSAAPASVPASVPASTHTLTPPQLPAKAAKKNVDTTSGTTNAVNKGKRRASTKKIREDPEYNEDEEVFDNEPSSDDDEEERHRPRKLVIAPRPARRMSTRERTKPKRPLGGFDGVMDFEDEEDEGEAQKQFKSEYDRYQALTSPGTPIRLGKRATRKQINFAEQTNEDWEDDEEEFDY